MEATSEGWSWGGLEGLERELRQFLARRCRDDSEVDDVIQETYLRAARYRHALQAPGKLRGWATRIAANVLRDVQRRECRLPRADLRDASLDLFEGGEPDPAGGRVQDPVRIDGAWWPRALALEGLARALGDLREEDRKVLTSFYGGGLCSERTARDCGLPRPLVKVRLFRARGRLKRRILTRSLAEVERGQHAEGSA